MLPTSGTMPLPLPGSGWERLAFGGTGVSTGTGIKRTHGRIPTSKRRHNASAPGIPFFLNRQVVRFAEPRPRRAHISYLQLGALLPGAHSITASKVCQRTGRTTVARLQQYGTSIRAPIVRFWR